MISVTLSKLENSIGLHGTKASLERLRKVLNKGSAAAEPEAEAAAADDAEAPTATEVEEGAEEKEEKESFPVAGAYDIKHFKRNGLTAEEIKGGPKPKVRARGRTASGKKKFLRLFTPIGSA